MRVLVVFIFLISSCGNSQKEVNNEQIVVRHGVAYEINSDKPFTGIRVSHHDNGQIKSKWTYKNGIKNGPYIRYFENGSVYGKKNYKNGESHGEYLAYRRNGQLYERRIYEDGEMTLNEYYRKNGQIESRDIYKNGERIKSEFYDEQGNLD